MVSLVKIVLNLNTNDYYIGYIVDQNQEFVVLQSIDADGNLGGLEYIKNSAIKTIKQDSPELDFCNHFKVRDIFNLKKLNSSFLSLDIDSFESLLAKISTHELITVSTKNGNDLTGHVLKADNLKVLFKLNNQEYPLVIPIEDIVGISINDIKNILENIYHEASSNQDDLVALYLDYEDDERFGEALIGAVVFHNDDYLVLESLNDIGQLDSYVLINRNYIVHTDQDTELLSYYSFLKKWQIKNGSFDFNNLRSQLIQFDQSISIDSFLQSKIGDMVTINDYQLDNVNTGKIVKLEDKKLYLSNIDDFRLSNNIQEFNYSDLASVDLISNDLLRMKQFFN
ncbi:hypothetical protein J2Z60_001614 [Lactobacillus colini]|uniref:Uncharacterized protein n=1 Tax=Lactobacillus colini TaxID=1819254 RepID=A0ABS4MFH4_9LACO|nr:hypothetical protein [Lactobacillus colini]MBP2058435.1 hypothetical protein [Lactobacillus colini]